MGALGGNNEEESIAILPTLFERGNLIISMLFECVACPSNKYNTVFCAEGFAVARNLCNHLMKMSF